MENAHRARGDEARRGLADRVCWKREALALGGESLYNEGNPGGAGRKRMAKRKWYFVGGGILLWLVVVIASLVAFPAWRADAGSILQLLGASAVAVAAFVAVIAGIAASLGFFKDKQATVASSNSVQIEQAGSGSAAVVGDVGGDVIVGSTVIKNYAAAERRVDALHQLPGPPADFTGREKEIEAIRGKIQGGVTVSGIRGMGGIGKTALALKLADLLAPLYPEAQFFLDLRGADKQEPLTPTEAMRHVILSMEPTVKLPDEPQQIEGLYHSLLYGKKALLFWDNARDAEQVKSLHRQGCLTLITSRQHFRLAGLEPFDLDRLNRKEARTLIRKIAGRVKAEEADEIARLCDYLPLAMRLAAGALGERKDLTPGEYAERLQDAKMRLGLVEASLRLSYDLLGEDLKPRFSQLGVFPGPFEKEAAAGVWGLEVEAASDVLGELLGRSLLDYDARSGRYDLHDLARLFAADRLSREAEQAKEAVARHAEYYLRVGSECDDEYEAGGEHIAPALGRFREIWPQLDAAWERMSLGWGEDAVRPENADRWLSDFPTACAYLLELQLPPRRRVEVLERAVQAARDLSDRQAEGAHLGNLGLAYAALGEARKAIEFHEQALGIDREIGDRRGEGADLGNLGLAYADLGEARKAIEFHEQRMVIAREIGDRRGEGADLGNLGDELYGLGEKEQGVRLMREALQIYIAIESPSADWARGKLRKWGEGEE